MKIQDIFTQSSEQEYINFLSLNFSIGTFHKPSNIFQHTQKKMANEEDHRTFIVFFYFLVYIKTEKNTRREIYIIKVMK